MSRVRNYVVVGVVAASFLFGGAFVSAEEVSTASLTAQINTLLLLIQDLQRQIAALALEQQSAAQVPAGSVATTSVTLLSPSNEVSFMQGQPITISWSGGGSKVQLGLVDKAYETDHTVLGWISRSEKPNSSLVWDGEQVTDLAGTAIQLASSLSKGPYKIIAVSAGSNQNYCVVEKSGCNYNVSGSYFSIILPAPAHGPLLTTCAPTPPTTIQAGEVVVWEATTTNGRAPLVYRWNGTDGLSALPPRAADGGVLEAIYHSPGLKTASVTVRDANGQEGYAPCRFVLGVTQAPAPLTVSFPNGGESFVLTEAFDPSQFVRVWWQSNGLPRYGKEQLQIALQDTQGRECIVGKVPRQSHDAFIGLVNGLVCPQNNQWVLSPGQYKVKVSLEGKESTIFDTSDSYFTLTPPVSDVQAIIPSVSSINSGESVKFHLFAPAGTVRAALYFFCPDAVTASTTPGICNHYTDVSSYIASSTDYIASFVNASAQTQTIAANFYVYLPNNQSYGRGVPTQLAVFPAGAATNNSLTVLAPNGGEAIHYGEPFVFRFTSTQAGAVDLTLVPYPPIDAGLVCKIARDVPASDGALSLSLQASGSCIKGPANIAPGNYTLLATLRDSTNVLTSDSSNSSFTISATSTPTP